MKDLIVHQIRVNYPSYTLQFKEPLLNEKNLPHEINTFAAKDTLYLSYAKWDEKCPENCNAPLDYCPVHKRNKPFTVIDIIKNAYDSELLYSFESEQLAPGIGGINCKKMEKLLFSLDQAILSLKLIKKTKISLKDFLKMDLIFPKKKMDNFRYEIYNYWESGIISKHIERSKYLK